MALHDSSLTLNPLSLTCFLSLSRTQIIFRLVNESTYTITSKTPNLLLFLKNIQRTHVGRLTICYFPQPTKYTYIKGLPMEVTGAVTWGVSGTCQGLQTSKTYNHYLKMIPTKLSHFQPSSQLTDVHYTWHNFHSTCITHFLPVMCFAHLFQLCPYFVQPALPYLLDHASHKISS